MAHPGTSSLGPSPASIPRDVLAVGAAGTGLGAVGQHRGDGPDAVDGGGEREDDQGVDAEALAAPLGRLLGRPLPEGGPAGDLDPVDLDRDGQLVGDVEHELERRLGGAPGAGRGPGVEADLGAGGVELLVGEGDPHGAVGEADPAHRRGAGDQGRAGAQLDDVGDVEGGQQRALVAAQALPDRAVVGACPASRRASAPPGR